MPDIAAISRAIDDELEGLAHGVIQRHLDLTDPANQRFLRQPDGREQHQARWHQWGIITHTRVFLHDFETEVPRYLRAWDLWDEVNALLQTTIDGTTRWELLRISILLHDIGKFATRTQGMHSFHFAHHEDMSGEIIRSELNLARFDLTPCQIEYIATTAQDHFVLALVRKRAREQGGYHNAYVRSPSFWEVCQSIRRMHPQDFVEIGLLFLGDSLAKANPSEGPPDALSQYEINIVVARRYLEVVLEAPHEQ